MSRNKGINKLVVSDDTTPSLQELPVLASETLGVFVHSTNSTVPSKLFLSQGTSTQASFSRIEFDTDSGLGIFTDVPFVSSHDASIKFKARGTDYWKIEGVNGSSGDLLPLINNQLKIGRSGFNLAETFSRKITSDTTLALAAGGATKWNLDSGGNLIPSTANSQNFGATSTALSQIFGNQLNSGTGQALYLGSNGGAYQWRIANGTNAAFIPNSTYDIGASGSRVGKLWGTDIDVTGTINSGGFSSSGDVITNSIRTIGTSDNLVIKTGTGFTERFRIGSDGNVTVSKQGAEFYVGNSNTSTQSCLIQIGNGRTGSGQSYIDFIGDTTYSDFGLRISREASGANADSVLSHRGTGSLLLQTQDAAPIVMVTGLSERMRITSTGKVGIGTTSPYANLDVASSLQIGSSSTSSNNFHITAESTGALQFWSGNYGAGTERMRIASTGMIGIGTNNPLYPLDVIGSVRIGDLAARPEFSVDLGTSGGGGFRSAYISNADGSNVIFSNQQNGYFALHTNNTERMRIDADGVVMIRPAAATLKVGDFATSTETCSIQVGNGRSGSGISQISLVGASSGGGTLRMTRNGGLNGTGEISHSGTGTLDIRTSAAANLTFSTNATERMRITSSGLIEMSTPGAILNVGSSTTSTQDCVIRIGSNRTGDGNSYLEMATDTTYGFAGTQLLRTAGANGTTTLTHRGTGGLVFNANEASDIVFKTTNTERMRITSTGNVGIGTASPTNTLDVVKNINGANYIFVANDDTGEGASSAIRFRTGGIGASVAAVAKEGVNSLFGERMIITAGQSGPMIFRTGNLDRMRISDNGNVGIGTNNPLYTLHVTGNAYCAGGLHVLGAPQADSQGAHIGWNLDGGGGETWFMNSRGTGLGGFVFVNKATGELPNEKIIAQINDYALDTYRIGADELRIYASSSVIPGSGALRIFMGASAITSEFLVENYPASTSHHWTFIRQALGTGRIKFINGTAGVELSAGATSWTSTSDVRLKQDIEKLKESKNIILNLNPVQYKFKNNQDKLFAGFIAQEVVDFIPEAVVVGDNAEPTTENENNFNYWGITPDMIIPYLTKALQEAFEEIQKLKERIEVLES